MQSAETVLCKSEPKILHQEKIGDLGFFMLNSTVPILENHFNPLKRE